MGLGSFFGDAWDWAKDHPGTIAGSVLFPGVGTALGYGLDASGASGEILGGIGDVLTPARADLGPLNEVIDKSMVEYDRLGNERRRFVGEYDPTRSADIYGQQRDAISMLADAAAGKVPSPAELQLQRQSGINSARSFGLASALQGRSPGGALRGALDANSRMNMATNADASLLRARETADARSQLVGALSGVQQQNLLQRQIDEERRRSLLNAQIGSLGAAGGAAGSYANASAADAAGRNAFKGSLINTAAGFAPLAF